MWTQIRKAIESLTPHNVETRKIEILALLDHFEQRETQPRSNAHERLSPREREVMMLMLTGRRLKEIAAQLNISVKTVTTHRARLLRKLGVADNLGLYRYAVRQGLIAV
jgi:DNA-binding NarL/FixJ family response regulator